MTDDRIGEIDLENASEEDDLLFSVYTGIRIFTLNNATATTITAALVEESDDSFLVALPCRLIEDERTKEYTVTPIAPVPYLRLMKTAVLTVVFGFGIFEEKYLEYVAREGKDIYPPILELIDETIVFTEAPVTQDNPVADISLNTGSQEKALGMTDEELEKYLTDKYGSGEVYGGSGGKQ